MIAAASMRAAAARRRDRAAYRPAALALAQALGRAVFSAAFRLQVRGRELVPTEGAVILAGNHTGFLDGPLVVVQAPRRTRALTKAELYRGLLGTLLTLIGQIPVRRGIPDRAALRACERELAAGGVVAIFPEGTRGAGDLRQLHRGVGWLALRSGAAVVPVACIGTAAALPRGSRRPHLRVPVLVSYGVPFRIEPSARPHSSASVSRATEEIRLRLVAHLATTTGQHLAGSTTPARSSG